MTLVELQAAFEQRDLHGVSVTCWNDTNPMWTASTKGEVAAGTSLSAAVLNLLDKFPVIQQDASS